MIIRHLIALFTDKQIVPRAEVFRFLFWYSLFCIVPFLIYAHRYTDSLFWPNSGVGQIFLLTSLPGQVILILWLLMLVAALFVLFFPRKIVLHLVTVLIFSLGAIALISDSVIYNLYRFHMNGVVWSLLVNGGVTEIIPVSSVMWIMIALVIATVVILQTTLLHFTWKWLGRKRPHGRRIGIGLITLILMSQSLHAWADVVNLTEVTKLARVIPLYPGLTVKKTLAKYGVEVEASEYIQIPSVSGLAYPNKPLHCDATPHKKNIVLVAVDGWRFDMLDERTTPNVFQFSQKAQRFDNHISSGNATRFGIFGLFYGMYGTYWHTMLAEQRGPVLIDELDKQKYNFGIFASARLTSPEFDRTIFSRIRDRIDLKTPGRDAVARDQEITRRFEQFVTNTDNEPFFSFVFYDATHSYDYPPESGEPFKPVLKTVNHLDLDEDYDPVPYRNKFLNSVHYVDQLMGRVLDILKEKNLLENTVVILTGDHGEEFNETNGNYWGHTGNFTRYQTQVPFIYFNPGQDGRNWSHLSSHLDVVPTLMDDVLGCDGPINHYSHGRSLWDTAERDFVVASGWDRFALYNPQQIDVVFNAGFVEHYDSDYRELAQGKADPKRMRQVMAALSQFHKK